MRTRPLLPRCLLLLVILALVAGACVAAGTPDDTSGASPTSPGSAAVTPIPASPTPAATPALLTPDEFWASLFYGDVEFASFPSIDAMAKHATAVVVARMESIIEAPPYMDRYGNLMFRATARLETEAVLHGSVNSAVPGTVTVQVVLGWQFAGDNPDPWQAALAGVQASFVNERAILFLIDEKSDSDRAGAQENPTAPDPTLYRVFASNGFIRDDNGVARPSTLTEKAWTKAIDGRPFDDVVAEVAATKPAD